MQVATLLGALKQFPDLELSALLLNSGRLSDELALRGIPVTVFDESRLGITRLLLTVTRQLKQSRPHILHSHRYKENVLGALAGKFSCDPLTVQTYHGLEENLSGWAALKMNLYSRINGAVGKMMTDGAVGVSSEITQVLKGRFPSSDVRCIRNGIDLTRVAPSVDPVTMRAELGIAPATFVVGTVGRLMPIKGFEYLIEAFGHVRRQQSPRESKLVVVGDGPLRAALERGAERHGISRDVRFLGMRADVYDVIGVFDVFALPSLHEGIPTVLLEAMALGVPIVASKVGGIPEVLEDGKEAILVPAKDPDLLAMAIGSVAKSSGLRSELTRAARARVENRFSIERLAVKTREIYRALGSVGKQ